MGTVDVAYTFCDLSRYLVASEETEPGNGWYYTDWVGALAEQPSMDGAALGRAICDAYYTGCELAGTEDSVTLSLTDLSQIGPLLTAYESYGAEALSAACQDPSFFTRFARVADRSENYGGNTREQGYTNMVDLGPIHAGPHGPPERRYAALGPGGAGCAGQLRAVSGEGPLPQRGHGPVLLLLL